MLWRPWIHRVERRSLFQIRRENPELLPEPIGLSARNEPSTRASRESARRIYVLRSRGRSESSRHVIGESGNTGHERLPNGISSLLRDQRRKEAFLIVRITGGSEKEKGRKERKSGKKDRSDVGKSVNKISSTMTKRQRHVITFYHNKSLARADSLFIGDPKIG